MKRIFNTISLLLLLLAAGTQIGCEDPAPTTYIPQYVVEGFMLVDDPIQGIRITRSQPLTDTFRYRNSAIPDADVKLIVDGRTLQLLYRPTGGVGEYFYPDSTERVKPSTLYRFEATTKDGTILTAETKTPERTGWIKAPHEVVQYPKDSTSLIAPDSLGLSWKGVPGVSEYIVSVRALDTLEYGKYLEPPTRERNRRIVRFFDSGDPYYNDVTRWGFVQNTGTPISWFAFKWYGAQEVTVYAPDQNFINWFKMLNFTQNAQYDPLLGNIEGGIGIFASASVDRQRIFVLKNQP